MSESTHGSSAKAIFYAFIANLGGVLRNLISINKEAVDRGQLVALDDPEIREIAAKYRDPDKLLRPVWTPRDDPGY
ncbi:MAG: hypothetical protein ACI9SC_000727 [Gammaproteobacteria bacterium]|jgi:hypothetical protein